MAKKVYDLKSNQQDFIKIKKILTPEKLISLEQVEPIYGFVSSAEFEHLCGFKNDLNKKLKISYYATPKFPTAGNTFILTVKLKNLKLGFGVFHNLHVSFECSEYTKLVDPLKQTVFVGDLYEPFSIIWDFSSVYVSFELKALKSAPAVPDNLNPLEKLGTIHVTGSFETLPWVNKKEDVSINITPL